MVFSVFVEREENNYVAREDIYPKAAFVVHSYLFVADGSSHFTTLVDTAH